MADPVSNWLISQGVNVASDFIKNKLEINSLDDIILQKASNIENKLDRLIKAPYKQSIFHLKEGEIDKAKDCLIHAISINKFDIPARLLYISILCYKKNYKLALDCYWELYLEFTFNKDLFPAELYKVFKEKTLKTPVNMNESLNVRFGYNEDRKKYFPQHFTFFLPCFCVTWSSDKWFLLSYTKEGINCFDWQGEKLFSHGGDDPKVISISYRYVVYEINARSYVFDLETQKDEQISSDEIDSIFKVTDSSFYQVFNLNNNDISFGTHRRGIMVKKGDTIKDEYYDKWETMKYGTLYIKRHYHYGTLDIKKQYLK